MGKRQGISWTAGAFILGVTVGVIGITMRNRLLPAPIVIMPPAPTALPTATAPPPPLRVYVNGAVQEADVYELPAGSILDDAIDAAGGFSPDADTRLVNLAQPVVDGMQIYIPAQEEGQAGQPPVVNVSLPTPTFAESIPAGTRETGALININTATAQILESLPGIGPVIAQRIIDYRNEHGPFAAIEDIQEVEGIGPTTYDELQDLITVD